MTRPTATNQLVVLGMHRSGTSMLAGLLDMMGCDLGPEAGLLPADSNNPKGYWESGEILALNDELLAFHGATWYQVADLDIASTDTVEAERYTARARTILDRLDARRPAAIKDPRLCVLFPIWREALQAPVCLLVHRSPLEIARSLQSRDGFPIPLGVALWERYTLDALRYSRGLPRLLVSHRDLLEAPVETAQRIHRELEALGVAGLDPADEQQVREFVDRSLFRSRGDAAEAAGYLGPQQVSLQNALQDGSALELDPLPELSPSSRELLTCAKLWQSADRLRRELAREQKQLADVDRDRCRQRRQLDRSEPELQAAFQWVGEMEELLRQTLGSRRWQLSERAEKLLSAALRRSSRPTAGDRAERILSELRIWRENRDRRS